MQMLAKVFKKYNVVKLLCKKMGLLNASAYIMQRIYKRNNHLKLKIKNTGLNIYLRNNPYDRQVFTQIFIWEELGVNYAEPPKVIIDGGANIGLATLYLKNKYPDARIIAVEPEHSNFELLLKNTASYPDVFCLKKGIWNKNCRLQIIDNGDGNASFITKELEENEMADDVINAITITGIMNQYDLQELDLVKLDIEGSERFVFEKNYEEWLSKTKEVIVEIHPYLHPHCEATVLNALNKEFMKSSSGEYFCFTRKKINK